MKFEEFKERFDNGELEQLKKDFEEMSQSFQKSFNFAITVQVVILLVVALHLNAYLQYEDESPLKFVCFSMVAAIWYWHAVLKGLKIKRRIKEIRAGLDAELNKQGENKDE